MTIDKFRNALRGLLRDAAASLTTYVVFALALALCVATVSILVIAIDRGSLSCEGAPPGPRIGGAAPPSHERGGILIAGCW